MSKFGKISGVFGPAFITAATVLGPGSITVCSKAGAMQGYSLLWVVALSAVFMICCTRIFTKIGCLNNQSLLTLVGENYGKVWPLLMGLSVFVSCAGFQTGNNIGIGLSMTAMFGGSMALWAFLFTAIALLFIWTSKNFYNVLEKVMLLMVLLMIAAFAGNVYFTNPDVKGIGLGLLPSLSGDLGMIIAISSTSCSVAAAAGQSYMVQAKNWSISGLRKGLHDSTLGIITLCGLSTIIIISSAAVLAPKGITVDNAIQMAAQLEPLLGAFAKWLFLTGLFAASFSSFLGNVILSGMFLADALHLGKTINDPWVKIFASVQLFLASCIAVFFNANPIQLLVMAQATTCLGYPLLIVMLFLLSNNRNVIREYKNRLFENIILILATIWIFFLSYRQLSTIIY
ncbi:MAG: divalent metal cation transporter [Tannerellaceae bacterium]|nr:divalent metal cation transporter [Tannerellaceae bacterium]